MEVVESEIWTRWRGSHDPENIGELQDIYVFDSDLEDWDRAIAFIRATYPCKVTIDDKIVTGPVTARRLHDARELSSPTLRVDLGGFTANSYFFCTKQIDFDIAVREISNERKFQHLLEFLRAIGTQLSKVSVLTMEGGPEQRLIEYRPADNCVQWVGK